MREETLKILKMIEEGIITAEEGGKLIEAMENKGAEPSNQSKRIKWIRIKVTGGRQEKNYNVKIPANMIKVGLKLGAKFNLSGTQGNMDQYYQTIQEAIQNEKLGEVLNVESEDGEKIQIILE